ncbi:MAG: hypothetical protein E4H09_03045, partial [Spirochaetales bacterium]
VLSLELLSYILLCSSAAPLQMSLIESGLGEDLSESTGIQTELLEMVFSAGIRGTDLDQKSRVEALVLDTLQRIVSEGLDPDIVEGALRKVEFRNREIKGGGPNGLRLMGRSLRGWLHDQKPEATLRFNQPFGRLRKDVAADPRFFEKLIQTELLANLHRSTVSVVHDPEQRQREQARLAAALEARERQFTAEDRARITSDQVALDLLQDTPDSPEAIATLPFLSVRDLPKELDCVATRESSLPGGVPYYIHDLFTNGIVYLDLTFDISGLANDLLPFVSLYTSAINEVGLPGKSYDVVATELELKTGGFGGYCEAAVAVHAVSSAERRIFFRLKTLESTVPQAVDLVADILTRAQFQNLDRLSDLVKEARSEMSGAVLPSGHGFAALRAARTFSQAARYEEIWRGAEQLLFLSGERDTADYARALDRINDAVIRSGNLAVNITAPGNIVSGVRKDIERLVAAIPAGGFTTREALLSGDGLPRAEGLLVSSDVAFVAAAIPGSRYGSPEYVHEQVLAHIMRTGFLWEVIRMKGGAYGANASARGLDGVFGFWSYRDPRIVETIAAFGDALLHYADGNIDPGELDLAIIGVTGHHIRPRSPGQKGMEALRRQLYGITDEMRQANHQTLLRTSVKDLVMAADRLRESMAQSVVAVVAGAEAIRLATPGVPGLGEHLLQLPG